MQNSKSASVNWQAYAIISLIMLAGITVVAGMTGQWVLTAIPIGFLFGFFLNKGDLCGSSAFSEIILMRDTRKVAGLWILIVVAMAGIALLDIFDLVTLNPKPMFYLSYIVGGVVFGVGMVLAGGCVSGCLYKGAAGNMNSIVALLSIPVGVMMVEFGPLHGMHLWMKQHVMTASGGERLSLYAVTGLPYWLLAALFGIATLVVVMVVRKRGRRSDSHVRADNVPFLERIMIRSWRPWAAGIAIGLLMVPAYLSSAASGRNYPLGVTHGVMQVELLMVESGLTHVHEVPTATAATPGSPVTPKPSSKKVVWWLVAGVLSLMAGSWVSARMSGRGKLQPKPPDEMLVALLGGLLCGIGAAFAGGCVVGNIMSGWALMSIGTVLFGIVVILTNWLTTYLYLMGGQHR